MLGPLFSAHGAYLRSVPVTLVQPSGEKLEAFASFYGADFYKLPRNTNKIVLNKKVKINKKQSTEATEVPFNEIDRSMVQVSFK